MDELVRTRKELRMNFGTVVVIAGFSGVFSFGFLAAAIGSDYWYIIKVNQENITNSEDLDSHSGLWRINEGKNSSSHFIHPFTEDTSSYSEPERHLLSMHKVIVILLPLSLVLLVFGGICGLVSSLAHNRRMLITSASYFLFCSLFTLSGVSLYISYSQQAWQEMERQLGAELLAPVQVSFGWSLGLAWLSYGLEVAAGLLLLLAARMTHPQLNEFTTTMAMA
ncbi:transmembrane protein 235-like [Anguilla anguilla]|uniref:transmembrane protein 235-like n=1 Tax=Anguilla anguilla TaxID=7936 RepID=UPI0015AB2A5B|nr:transmembrane protein 235-like [Anguilla anguilla]